MSKQQFSRNPRSRSLKPKHALQIFLVVAMSIWLIYQLKHSYGKTRSATERGGGSTNDKLVRSWLSRKDFLDLAGQAVEDDILGKGDENDVRSGDEEEERSMKVKDREGGNEQEDEEADDGDEGSAEEEEDRESSTTTHLDGKEMQFEHGNGKVEEKSDNTTEKECTIGRVCDWIAVPQVNIGIDCVNNSIATAASLATPMNDVGSSKNGFLDVLYHDREGTINGNQKMLSNATMAVPAVADENHPAASVTEHNSTIEKSELNLEPTERLNTTAGQDGESHVENSKEGAIWGNSTPSANETVSAVLTAR